MDERYDIRRGVRTKEFKYILNLEPWRPVYQHVAYGEQSTIMKEIRRLKRTGELKVQGIAADDVKPVEELYDLKNDPYETINLAKSPEHQETLRALREQQKNWSDATRDLGLMPEAEIARREKSAGSRYAILHDDAGLELVKRLREVALAATDPEVNSSKLAASLRDSDPAVRYWGIIGLSHLKDGPATFRDQVIEGAKDQPPVVQVAVGYFLVVAGSEKDGFAKLREGLRDPSPWVRLEAATFAEELGGRATSLVDDLKQAAKGDAGEANGNRYPIAVAKHVLELLGQK